ncbi:cytosine permease [Curtobacterium sp. Csp1]|uniref:Cytosine permease n=1 Tax=Curtobacterium citreum TaxID=2036 RepID=A0ABT2HCY3_9MICO|nr:MULTISPECIES: cytosine permease [Curtobacterium]MCS6521063.1 cytosine permease [Curtobacterium citreum]QKS21386.1 cytosine permease [Curtobacterium sp. Csp1]RDH96118.1 purine-cytosine permease-like protein [Curtobacterium sp. AG1037]TQJ27917.1 purine-cytosine permease-like protein [Curtobacterium citreum]GGL71077.1 allantoin permease [Curtobacterium citreum]
MAQDTTTLSSGTLTTIEQRGIEPVPHDERNGAPGALFWVWFAANISILGLPLGATLVAFQRLNIWQALLVAVIGAAGSFAVVGVISIAGRRGGAPGLTLSRAVFGVRGNIGPTAVSLLSRLGWETVNTTTAAFVLLSLFTILFGTNGDAKANPVLTIVAILVFVAATVLVSGLGHAFIVAVQKWATWVFGALNVFVAVFLIVRVNWDVVGSQPAGPVAALVIGVGTIAAGTGIGWATAGADIARYTRTSVKAGALISASAAGAGIPLVVLVGLGALVSAGDPTLAQAGDPVAAIRDLLPSWMAIPYLIAAFGGLLLSNHLSVYSASLTTLTLGVKVPRVWAVGVDVVVTTLGAMYFMLVADGFYAPFITFISVLAVPITAWLGVFTADMLRRRWYDPTALLDLRPGGRYWYRGGVAWGALGAWVVAIVVGFLFTSIQVGSAHPIYVGALSDSWIGANGLGWVVTFVVAAAAYLLTGGARGQVVAPTEARS